MTSRDARPNRVLEIVGEEIGPVMSPVAARALEGGRVGWGVKGDLLGFRVWFGLRGFLFSAFLRVAGGSVAMAWLYLLWAIYVTFHARDKRTRRSLVGLGRLERWAGGG